MRLRNDVPGQIPFKRGEVSIKHLHGNLTGLKPSQIRGLEKLYRGACPYMMHDG